MKKLFYLTINIVFLSLIIGCKKENKTSGYVSVSYNPISADIKDYCYFKIGSYWVYEDSISGSTDSMYVTNSYIGQHTITAQDNVGYTGTFDFFNVFIFSTRLGGEYHLWTDATFWQAPNLKNIPRVYIENTKIISGYNQTILMFTNETLNANMLYTDNGGEINYLGLLNYDTGYYSFQNVKQYLNTKNYTQYGHQTYCNLAKNIGIISYKVLPGGTDSVSYTGNWSLKNYYIIQ